MLPDPRAAVMDAASAGVERILAVGIDIRSSRLAVAFAHEFPSVLAAVGIHPHDAAGASAADFEELESLAEDPEVVAIGETGLDYYHDRAPRDTQQETFRRHVRLALDHELPLVVHSREAAADTMDLLAGEAAGATVILHCFSLVDHVEECARRGYYMSLAGNVSYRNAMRLHDATTRIPADLLLTETDSPYLSSVPHRGSPNCPARVAHVADAVASLRDTSIETLAAAVHANFHRAFNLSP